MPRGTRGPLGRPTLSTLLSSLLPHFRQGRQSEGPMSRPTPKPPRTSRVLYPFRSPEPPTYTPTILLVSPTGPKDRTRGHRLPPYHETLSRVLFPPRPIDTPFRAEGGLRGRTVTDRDSKTAVGVERDQRNKDSVS